MIITFKVFSLTLCAYLVAGDRLDHAQRRGRQNDPRVQGGVDFTGCQPDPKTGFCCVEKDEEITSLQKDPILECTHKNVEKCHYTYVTQFDAAQEEVCDENFEKSCQVTFKQQAFNETVKKCYRPLEKVCDGSGPQQCKTVYETACTTRYVEKQPGKFVGDSSCEKLPVEICGAGCVVNEGAEECHEKVITSLVDVPEETCDLNPQKTCRFVTKLVPKLKPKHECTTIPKETCNLKFSSPQEVKKTLKTRWCQDPKPTEPGDSYEEGPDTPGVIQAAGSNQRPVTENNIPQPLPPIPSDFPGKDDLPTYQSSNPQTPAHLYDAPLDIDPRSARSRQGRRQPPQAQGRRPGRHQQ